MKSVVFLGAKKIGFDCLTILASQASNLNFDLIAVGTNTKTILHSSNNNSKNPWNEFCQTRNIAMINDLDEVPNCDILLSVQYDRILKKHHIARAQQIAVNLHLAPLPEYRGCNQFSFAIIDQAKTFGVTLHRLETAIDSGDIICETRFDLPKQCFVQELYELSCHAALNMFAQQLPNLLSGNYDLIPQELLIAERGTSYHYRHEINELKKIDLNWDSEKIERHIRATYFPPFEPPFVQIGNKKFYFQDKFAL